MARSPAIDPYVTDAATLQDGFGTTLAGDQVARVALEAATPFTVGVVGKWGSGKTSVLRRAFVTLGGQAVQLAVPFARSPKKETGNDDWNQWSHTWPSRQERLGWPPRLVREAESSLCVWYSPWQHQDADNPLLPLLLEIRRQFTVRARAINAGSRAARQGFLAGLTLLERVIDAALVLQGVSKRPLTTGTTEAVHRAWKSAATEPELDDGQRFHLLFEDAVATAIDGLGQLEGARRGRLIVFIDDLDRCEEQALVQLLEAIKLYLGAPRCVFVLGIDESALLAALGRHWQGRSEDANREYLEKLFQATVPVPLPRAAAVRRFVAGQLRHHDLPAVAALAELIRHLLEPNPRKVKNFVNSLCANWDLYRQACDRLADTEQRERFARRFVLLQYLRVHHKPVWRLLERQPWTLRLLTKVLSRGADQGNPLPEGVDPDDHRVAERLLFRAFAHVLRADVRTGEGDLDAHSTADHHGHLPIAEAVELFQERIDRKRSDERFVHHYLELFAPGEDLPEELLYLPSDDDDH